jgi:hypothetical protein
LTNARGAVSSQQLRAVAPARVEAQQTC